MAAIARGGRPRERRGFHYLTGIWPGKKRQEPPEEPESAVAGKQQPQLRPQSPPLSTRPESSPSASANAAKSRRTLALHELPS